MKPRNYFIIGLLVLIAACSETTSLIGVWQAEDYQGPKDFKKIAVVALTQNKSSQLVVEKTLIDRLKYLGYEAMYGSTILVPSVVKEDNKEMIEKMMKDQGVDAVMIISLLDVKHGTQYVPGSGSYSPGGYYGGYYGYYGYSYNHYYGGTPGYYQSTESYFVECNFYDVNENEKLVSSLQTETVDPSDIDTFADSFSYTVLKKLVEQKILENKTKK